ncbi:AhpC/TSA family protein [Ilumatobacter sp.]|uniref:AhpC/TSA family protein n=1 Tax=Ilumatobacter sp. TaxID=1967498 RepID=UPI003C69A2E5
MSERLDETATVVLVTFTTGDRLDDYQQHRSVSVPILIDADREVYRAYGLGRGKLRDVWGWATLRRYAQILRTSGVRHGLSEMSGGTEDTRQLGGDFVIAPDGTIAWSHRGNGPADRPSVDAIVGAVERATP